MKRKLETPSGLQSAATFPGFTIFLDIECLLSLRRTCSVLQKLKIHNHGYRFFKRKYEEFFYYKLHYLIYLEFEVNPPPYLQIQFPCDQTILQKPFSNVQYLFLKAKSLYISQSYDILAYCQGKNLKVLHFDNILIKQKSCELHCNTLIYCESVIWNHLRLPNLRYLILKMSWNQMWLFFDHIDFSSLLNLYAITLICSFKPNPEIHEDDFINQMGQMVQVSSVMKIHLHFGHMKCVDRLHRIFPNTTIKFFNNNDVDDIFCDDIPTTNLIDFWKTQFELQDQRPSERI